MVMKGVLLNKEELINLMTILKEKYGNLKISDLQNKISEDRDLNKLMIYKALFGGKKVKIFSKEEGFIQKIKKKGKKLS